jgi:hypothetical protein
MVEWQTKSEECLDLSSGNTGVQMEELHNSWYLLSIKRYYRTWVIRPGKVTDIADNRTVYSV